MHRKVLFLEQELLRLRNKFSSGSVYKVLPEFLIRLLWIRSLACTDDYSYLLASCN